MRGEFVDLDGERLYYYAAGTRGHGDPVLFVHGFPTSAHLWSGLIHLLPEGRRYLVLDQLGSGRSTASLSSDLSVVAHAERAKRFLDLLGVTRVTLVGHGVGALVMLRLIASDTSRCRGAVLISPADPASPLGRLRRLRRIRPLLRLAASTVGASLLHNLLVRGYIDRQYAVHSADQYARPFASEGGRDLLLAHLDAIGRSAGAISDMGEPPCRASIVWGGADHEGRAVAAAFARRFPAATLHEVEAAGVFVPEEAPEHLAAHLASCFRS